VSEKPDPALYAVQLQCAGGKVTWIWIRYLAGRVAIPPERHDPGSAFVPTSARLFARTAQIDDMGCRIYQEEGP